MGKITLPEDRFDVAVVGGGTVGASIALFSAERGLSVVLIEARSVGLGTSNNSFAWINATSKTSDENYHRLNASGAAGYRDLVARFGEERVGVHPTGMLQWASPSDVATRSALETRYHQLEAWGYPAALVDYNALIALEPHVRFVDGAVGLHAIADAWLDAPTYVGFASERIRELGGTLLTDTTAQELALSDDGVVLGLQTNRGRVNAEKVVVACGPNTPEVLAQLSGYGPFESRFPMQRAPGLLVRTPPVSPWRFARRILYSNEAKAVHIRPTPDGGLLLGADDTDGAAMFPEDSTGIRDAAITLLERTHALIPQFPGVDLVDESELKIGVRPVPADGHSIVSALPGSPQLFVACTHSGVTLGPAIGTLLAEELATGKRPTQLEPFGFGRFQSV